MGFYGHSDEYLGSIEPEQFLGQLSNYRIFRETQYVISYLYDLKIVGNKKKHSTAAGRGQKKNRNCQPGRAMVTHSPSADN
jgi:hypothetical protein